MGVETGPATLQDQGFQQVGPGAVRRGSEGVQGEQLAGSSHPPSMAWTFHGLVSESLFSENKLSWASQCHQAQCPQVCYRTRSIRNGYWKSMCQPKAVHSSWICKFVLNLNQWS